VSVGSPGAFVGDLIRPHSEVANAARRLYEQGADHRASGGMRSVGVAGGGLGWTDWGGLKED
jgi:hypothetical protein